VFRLTLPIASVSRIDERRLKSRQDKIQVINARVLVIDDDKAVLEGMYHLLRDWGCECDQAETIEQALELAQANTPDVVISDYRLRQQSTGVEAIIRLRKLLGNTLPALLITGDTAPERLREAQASGITLLHKPVSPHKLYRALAEVREAAVNAAVS
jgi:CheY-like chemotaxis protein